MDKKDLCPEYLCFLVYVYYDDHNPPHFHASHEGLEATFDFGGNLINGIMSTRANKLVKEWSGIHKGELEENWERARKDKSLNWIEPLR